jgi:protein-disulfide isomerase
MTSGKAARRKRQQQVARPPVRSTEGRRASPKVLLGAVAALALIAVAVVLALVVFGSGSGSSSTADAQPLPDANVIAAQFRGIPQQGNVLGRANAPVTMVEYIDLQCPICRQFETEIMPTILERYVRSGKLRVEARPIAFIGPDSERGRQATIAAGQQNHMFDFSQLLYFNQGPENGGWLDDGMVASAATSIPGVNVQALQDAMGSSEVEAAGKEYDGQATADNVTGTPTVLVGKTGGKLRPVGAGSPSVAQLSAAIDAAAK